MALQILPDAIAYPQRIPPYYLMSASNMLSEISLPNADDEIHMIGVAKWPNRANKTLYKIHIPCVGSVTPGTTLTAGVQNVSTTNVNPLRGDETFVISDTLVDPVAGIVAIPTGGPTIQSGRRYCFVMKVSSANPTWGVKMMTIGAAVGGPCVTTKVAGSWSSRSNIPNIILEAVDGSFGVLAGCSFVWDAVAQVFTNASLYKERGTRFSVPFKTETSMVWFRGRLPNDSDSTFNVSLYRNVDATQFVDIELLARKSFTIADITQQASSTRGVTLPLDGTFPLDPGNEYGLCVEATGAGNVYLEEIDMGSDVFAGVLPGGLSYRSLLRANSSSDIFSLGAANLYHAIGPVIDSFDDGAGGIGGVRFPHNLHGGFNG